MLVSLAAGLLLFRFDDARITEASGLAVACPSGLVLTHNDSGDTARFFAVDRQGRTVATYSLRGADAVDWEDMARDGDRLYLADIGDNARSRDHVDVYETAVPDGSGPTTLPATRHRLRYPDGAHDAEALLVRDGRIFVVVKSGDGAVYAAPDSGDGDHAQGGHLGADPRHRWGRVTGRPPPGAAHVRRRLRVGRRRLGRGRLRCITPAGRPAVRAAGGGGGLRLRRASPARHQ